MIEKLIKVITIQPNASCLYLPMGHAVRKGEKVMFTLIDRKSTATVTFDNGASCFDEKGPISLGGNQPLSRTLIVNAEAGRYFFTVNVSRGGEGSHLGSDAESKRGELDVTPEPPKEDK